MLRRYLIITVTLAAGILPAGAQRSASWACMTPDPKDTYRSLDKMPNSVAAFAQKRFPGLKNSMAECPQYGPTKEDDKKSACLLVAANFNGNWAIGVSTRGSAAIRAVSLYRDIKGIEPRELSIQESGISRCSINTLLGITPTPHQMGKPISRPNAVQAGPTKAPG
jgi:hypothetical protein